MREARTGETSSMQSTRDGVLLETEVKDNLISVLMLATPVTMLLISSPCCNLNTINVSLALQSTVGFCSLPMPGLLWPDSAIPPAHLCHPLINRLSLSWALTCHSSHLASLWSHQASPNSLCRPFSNIIPFCSVLCHLMHALCYGLFEPIFPVVRLLLTVFSLSLRALGGELSHVWHLCLLCHSDSGPSRLSEHICWMSKNMEIFCLSAVSPFSNFLR